MIGWVKRAGVVAAVVLVIGALWLAEGQGQGPSVVNWLCKTVGGAGYCPVSTTYPLPVQQVTSPGTPFIIQLQDPATPSNVQNILCQISAPLGGNVCTALVEIVGPDGSVLTPGSPPSGCAGATMANTTTKPFSNGGSGSNLLLVAGVAGEKIHICAIMVLPIAGAVNMALVEGTTNTNPCDTGTAGLIGGATAGTGAIMVTNQGFAFGNGMGLIAVNATTGKNACLLFSGAVQLSGVLTYSVY